MQNKKKYRLANSNIADIVDEISNTAMEGKFDKKEVTRIMLTLEEILLKFQNRFGDDVDVILEENLFTNKYGIKVKIASNSFNPFEMGSEEYSDILQSLLSGQGLAFQWSYRNGFNTLSYSFRKKRKHSTIIQLFVSILAAIACAGVCMLFRRM